ncbi:hypothetical protein GCM10007385_13010 [Tateyamaria omphalii]|uniref:hypothetical protein n=1 Tax=Tateyamaria omphalii TaxID=299262 RepID=UPI00167BE340|nr:hypothetical protein [Tateyamaria omphalii]GGX46778.1 hypothetical protein GCM10007385_13010 [Tateyamaria omphalii]
MRTWWVSVRNDSWNYTALQGRFRAYLLVDDLQERVAQALNGRMAKVRQHTSLSNGVSQISQEIERLHTFQERIANGEGHWSQIEIDAAEVPVDFNADLFEGRFKVLHCWQCQRLSAAENTWLDSFQETDGAQVFGCLRKCLCGNIVAYRIDGQRRP